MHVQWTCYIVLELGTGHLQYITSICTGVPKRLNQAWYIKRKHQKPPFHPQEPQAALHVPNVRAECLLKFQLRPVIEWQRLVCPSIPPISPTLLYSSEHRLVTENNPRWTIALSLFLLLSSFLTSSYKCQCGFFFSPSSSFYTLSVKRYRGASRSDVKRILVLPRQCFCRQRCVSPLTLYLIR